MAVSDSGSDQSLIFAFKMLREKRSGKKKFSKINYFSKSDVFPLFKNIFSIRIIAFYFTLFQIVSISINILGNCLNVQKRLMPP